MIDVSLVPPNLAAFGVRRRIGPQADLLTIWDTPYPVITNFTRVCRELGLDPFNGGTHDRQGPHGPGYVTSGYRDNVLEGRPNSPHRFGLALDVVVGDVDAQIEFAGVAVKHFTRVGLYPGDGFVHVDLCPLCWMQKYGGRRFWVRRSGTYTSFDTFEAAVDFTIQQ
jgi:hypothetical protein